MILLPCNAGRSPVLVSFAHAPIGFKSTTRGLLHQRIPYASLATRSVANYDASVVQSAAKKRHRFFDLRVDEVFEHVIGHSGVPVVTKFLRRLDVIDDGDVVESVTPRSEAFFTRVDVIVNLRSGKSTLVEIQLRRHMFELHRYNLYNSEEFIEQRNLHVQDVRVVIITSFDFFPGDEKHDLVVHLANDVNRRINVAEDLKGKAGPRLVNSFREYTQMTIVQLPRCIPDLSVDPKAA
jgi:hypothetical protein